jgi:hypothetical protein
MDVTIQVENIFEFLKNNSDIKIAKMPSPEIANIYLSYDRYEDSDFQYYPKDLLGGLLENFMYLTEYTNIDKDWYRKFDNLVSIFKNSGSDYEIRDLDYFANVYEKTEYEPLLNFIVEIYRPLMYSSKRRFLYLYTPKLFKKLVVLGLIPPPYNPEEQKLYKEATHDAILDMSIGLRGSGLPSLVLENIANQAYNNPTGMDVYKLVKNVTERKK